MAAKVILAKNIKRGDKIVNVGKVKKIDIYANAVEITFDPNGSQAILAADEYLKMVYPHNKRLNVMSRRFIKSAFSA